MDAQLVSWICPYCKRTNLSVVSDDGDDQVFCCNSFFAKDVHGEIVVRIDVQAQGASAVVTCEHDSRVSFVMEAEAHPAVLICRADLELLFEAATTTRGDEIIAESDLFQTIERLLGYR